MLRIVVQKVGERELLCPVVFCDFCGRRIENAKEGNYEYRGEDALRLKGAEVKFVHKDCCREFETAHGERVIWYWDELQAFLVFLGNNLSLDWEHAREQAERAASL